MEQRTQRNIRCKKNDTPSRGKKYFKESFDQYNNWFKEEYSEKVVSVSYNEPFDAYPDVYATLESGKILPIEVEWTTKDFNHDPHSSVFDVTQTQVIKNKFSRVLSWYDNEWGFSNRMCDTSLQISKLI